MKFIKFFNSFLVLIFVFTMLSPTSGNASTQPPIKAVQFQAHANGASVPGLLDYSIDDMEISPNDDGKIDSTNINLAFNAPQPVVAIEVWDALHPDGGPNGDGLIGFAALDVNVPAGNYTIPFDGTYLSTKDDLKVDTLPDGVYSLVLWTANDGLTNFIILPQEIGPIFVKKTPPRIEAYDVKKDRAKTVFSGFIRDPFVNWQRTVYDYYGSNNAYKPNSKLIVTCDVTNSKGIKVADGINGTVGESGWFDCPAEGLTVGENKIKVYVDDIVQHHAEAEYTIFVEDIYSPRIIPNVTNSKGGDNLLEETVAVSAYVTDDLSGIKKTEYRVNGKEWVPHTVPFWVANRTDIHIEFRSYDNAGNYSYADVYLMQDKKAPYTISSIRGTEGKTDTDTYRSDVTLTLSAFDDASGVKLTEYKLNDEEWTNYTGPLTFTKEGAYKVSYRSTDYTGKTNGTNDVYFKIDKTPPAITGVENGKTYNSPVTITYNEGEGFLNKIPINSGTVVKKPGTYTMVVTDNGMNKSTVSFTIEKTVAPPVDPTPPPVVTPPPSDPGPIVTPPSPSPPGGTVPMDKTPPTVNGVENYGAYNKDVTITFSDGTATLNGKEMANKTVVKVEGIYELVVTDAAGNATTIHFTIDKKAPTVTGAVNNASYNKNVTIKFSDGTATLNADYIDNNTVVQKDGIYVLVVTDDAGNTTTIKFTIDKKAPTVTGVVNNGYYNKDVTIKFSDGKATLNGKTLKNSTGVKAAETYVLVVTDTAGNKTTIKFTIDKTAPKSPTVNTVMTKSKTVTGKAEKGGTVYLYSGKKLLGKAIANAKGDYSIKLAAQKKGTTLTIFAKDPAGNQSKAVIVKVK